MPPPRPPAQLFGGRSPFGGAEDDDGPAFVGGMGGFPFGMAGGMGGGMGGGMPFGEAKGSARRCIATRGSVWASLTCGSRGWCVCVYFCT